MIDQNLTLIRDRIEKTAKRAKRNPQDITLICVTKQASLKQVEEVISFGATDIGENRVIDALLKYNQLKDSNNTLKWHMIGHLQSNKVKKALSFFDTIHSVDSIRLASEINRQAELINKRIDCFIEVNVAGEDSKYGIKPDQAHDFVKEASLLSNIKIVGLMMMAPFVDNPEEVRSYFKDLRNLRDSLLSENIPNTDIRELSMGMTQDFEVAIEEGATMVRIGTAIFSG